jgi:hypothetical protein
MNVFQKLDLLLAAGQCGTFIVASSFYVKAWLQMKRTPIIGGLAVIFIANSFLLSFITLKYLFPSEIIYLLVMLGRVASIVATIFFIHYSLNEK